MTTTTRKALPLALLLAVGCFDSDDLGAEAPASSTDGGADETSETSDETGAVLPDLPHEGQTPELTSLLVDGDESPKPLLAAAELEVLATVADPSAIDSIVVYLDDEELTSLSSPPFATTIRFNSSSQNGVHELRAVAHGLDGGDDQRELSLTVDLPERGAPVWAHHDESVASLRSVFPDEDGSALVLSDPRVLRFSPDGAVLESWESELLDGFSRATHGPDQGIVALVKPPNSDYLAVHHFDAELTLIWTAKLGPILNQASVSVDSLAISGEQLILAGARKPAYASWHCPWLVRTTPLSPTLGFDWSSALSCTGELGPEWIGAMALAPDGTVYVVHEGLPVPKLVHLSLAGEFVWSTTLEDQAATTSMAIDPDGNLYIAGLEDGGDAGQLLSLDAHGALRWSTTTDTEMLTVVSFDPVGRRVIAVAPKSDPQTPAQASVVEHLPSGLPLPSYELAGDLGHAFAASKLVVDELGYLYVAGALTDKDGGWAAKLHP